MPNKARNFGFILAAGALVVFGTITLRADDDLSPPKFYSSGLQILQQMPEKFRPHPVTGWEQEEGAAIGEWFRTVAKGDRFKTTCKVIHRRVRDSRKSFGPHPKAWSVALDVENEKFSFAGSRIEQRLGPLVVWYDEDPTKRWKDVRPGHVVTIEGRIDKLKFSTHGRTGSLDIVLTDVRITGPSIQ